MTYQHMRAYTILFFSVLALVSVYAAPDWYWTLCSLIFMGGALALTFFPVKS